MSDNKSGIVRAEVSRCRGKIYELLLRVFARLPDDALIQAITSQGFHDFLDTCCGIGSPGMREGVTDIKLYCSTMASKTHQEILNDLAVDRTSLLRATGDRALRPPYESLYRTNASNIDVITEIKNFYRRAGLLLDSNTSEMPDFMCVELDFMYQLCLRETKEWSCDGDTTTTLNYEEAFLRKHIGSWLGNYCAQAEKHARTRFYRGFLVFLNAFMSTEMEYLQSLTAPDSE